MGLFERMILFEAVFLFITLQFTSSDCQMSDNISLILGNGETILEYRVMTQQTLTLVVNQGLVLEADYNFAKDTLYWYDRDGQDIFRVSLEDSQRPIPQSPVPIAEDIGLSYDLAVDWIHNNLYWLNRDMSSIEVIDLDSRLRTVLVEGELQRPAFIELDPRDGQGYMYWINIGMPEAKIEKAGLDGSGREVLFRPGPNFMGATTLTLDLADNRLYWYDFGLNIIASSDLSGNNYRTVVMNVPNGFGVAVFGDFLYWVDYNLGSLLQRRKDDLGSPTTLITNQADLRGVRVYHASKQPTATNRCGNNNGCCAHLCLPSPTSYSCLCATNANIGSETVCDMPDCQMSDDNISLILGNGETILEYRVMTQQTLTLVVNQGQVFGADYNFAKDTLYWYDRDGQDIFRVSLEDSQRPIPQSPVPIAEELGLSFGMAVDWIHNNLYWLNRDTSSIEVIDLDSGLRTVLVEGELQRPAFIELDPRDGQGYMYWINIGMPEAKIEKAGLDGSGREVLFRPGPNFMGATTLTLDLADNRLYWYDFGLNIIASSDLNGNNYRTVVMNVPNGFGVAVFGDFLYWVDYDLGSLLQRRKDDLGSPTTLITNQANLRGVRVYHASKQPTATNRCGNNNGDCVHLCLPSPTSYSCLCATNATISSETVCDMPVSSSANKSAMEQNLKWSVMIIGILLVSATEYIV